MVLSKAEMSQLLAGVRVIKTSEEAMGHSHTFTLKWTKKNKLIFLNCDGKAQCPDKHGKVLNQVPQDNSTKPLSRQADDDSTDSSENDRFTYNIRNDGLTLQDLMDLLKRYKKSLKL